MTPTANSTEASRPAIRFLKVQALGNDLILIPTEDAEGRDWACLARVLCRRNFGVGADGLLVLAPGHSSPWRMRMFNPDGSEDMCGNGLRCIGVYLQSQGLLPEGGVRLDTLAGPRRIRPLAEGIIEADMGEPRLAPRDLPMAANGESVIDYPLTIDGERWLITGVSMGTPHAVIFTERPVADEVFLRVSPLIEVHPLFPERTTVTWCHMQSRDSLRARFWERAVGESLACGTGASAAVVAARLKGLVDDEVTVQMPGGEVGVRWPGRGSLFLTGPASIVFEGTWPFAAGEPAGRREP